LVEPTTSCEDAEHKKRSSGPFSVAPKEELLYSLEVDGSRKWIDPVLSRGPFWRIRLALGWVLIATFVLAPHLNIGGKPGIFLDLGNRQFTFFGATFHPTDSLLLLAFGVLVILTVFAVTSVWGRLWCGYACPHPVYLEFVFRPIERWLEGSPSQRRRRDGGPWTLGRLGRKSIKWLFYAAISTILACTFVAYFVGWPTLCSTLISAPTTHTHMLAAVGLTAILVFIDFAHFRDQMCTVACPYGRLQTVLYDCDTVIVGYDKKRGEPRARKRDRDDSSGDCVDCGRCIATCPTGMDIRRGLQMECIGCAQCVEACDEVMLKTDKPTGLIRYTSLRELDTGKKKFLRPRVFVYGVLLVLVGAALVGMTAARTHASAELLRSGREPFRELPTGEIANMLRVRFTNNLPLRQSFTVVLAEPKGAELVVSQSPFVVDADAVATVNVVVKLSETMFKRGRADGVFVIESDAGVRIEEAFILLGPYR